MIKNVFLVFIISLGSVLGETIPDTETKPGSPLSPSEAAQAMTLPDGFEVTVFASEPDVRNPIDFSWDSQGRLWIAENYTYERRSDVTLPEELADRILIFSDEDGDGIHDTRQVFLEGLHDLTSIEWAPNGLYVFCPPRLLFFPNADGDDHADEPSRTLLNGFTIPEKNSHNFANGLRWGPDGWLYGRCGASAPGEVGIPGCAPEDRIPIRGGIWRYHPDHQTYETLCHGTTNPWGHDWNEDDELFFINTVNGHFYHLIPGAHYTRGVSRDPNPYAYQLIDHHADHWHFDTSSAWHKSRDGVANDFGGGHAHVGMVIYQGDNFPKEYHGNVLTLNLHGRRCNRETLHPRGSGYVAKHAPDFFLTKDPFFRGVELTTGPDGGLYVLDWSDTGECHESTGVHRNSGRIFKITYGKPERSASPKLHQASKKELQTLKTHPNVWQRRMAQLLLREPESSVSFRSQPDLIDSSRSDDSTLEAYPLDLFLPKSPAGGPSLNTPQERLKGASLLQRIPYRLRPELARRLLKHGEDADDHNIPLMIWYGLIPLAQSHPKELADLVPTCQIPLVRKFIARRLAEDLPTNPGPFNYLLKKSVTVSEANKSDIIEGLLESTRAIHQLPAPTAWPAFITSFENSQDKKIQQDLKTLAVLFGDGRALEDIKALVLNQKAPVDVRKSGLQTLIRAQHPELKKICLQLLRDKHLKLIAADGLTQFDDTEIAIALTEAYQKFSPQDRPKIITALTARPEFAQCLLLKIRAGDIPKSALSPYHARQIKAMMVPALSKMLTEVWGNIGAEGSSVGLETFKSEKKLSPQNLNKADLIKGKHLYTATCSACHKLNGQGGTVGPDLTGSGRKDLDYLLHNILHPSAEVTVDYQITVITLKDGRIVTGRIASETETAITLIAQNDQHTVLKTKISKRETLPHSLMPEGLLDNLTKEQIRDLIAYLMQS